jgi:hypothetical protein
MLEDRGAVRLTLARHLLIRACLRLSLHLRLLLGMLLRLLLRLLLLLLIWIDLSLLGLILTLLGLGRHGTLALLLVILPIIVSSPDIVAKQLQPLQCGFMFYTITWAAF